MKMHSRWDLKILREELNEDKSFQLKFCLQFFFRSCLVLLIKLSVFRLLKFRKEHKECGCVNCFTGIKTQSNLGYTLKTGQDFRGIVRAHGPLVWVFVGLLTMVVGSVSDAFACSWALFPPTGLPCLALI